MPEFPPWIQPGNEAAYTAQGIQIGMQQAAQQAAESYREQEMMRQDQLRAQDQARWQQEFAIKQEEEKRAAQQYAQQSQAMLAYQQAIQSGMDPMKAMMTFGLQAGAPGAALSAVARAGKPPTPWSVQQIPGLPQGITAVGNQNQIRFIHDPKQTQTETGPVQGVPVLDPSGKAVPGQYATRSSTGSPTVHNIPASEQEGYLSGVDKDELRQLENDEKRLSTAIEKEETGMTAYALAIGKEKPTKTDQVIIDRHKKKVDDLNKVQQDISDIYTKARRKNSKMQRAQQLAAQWNAANPNASVDEIAEAKKKILDEVNK
jgi:hypothetical protein